MNRQDRDQKRIRLDESKVLKLGRLDGEPTTRMIGVDGKPGGDS